MYRYVFRRNRLEVENRLRESSQWQLDWSIDELIIIDFSIVETRKYTIFKQQLFLLKLIYKLFMSEKPSGKSRLRFCNKNVRADENKAKQKASLLDKLKIKPNWSVWYNKDKTPQVWYNLCQGMENALIKRSITKCLTRLDEFILKLSREEYIEE